jgi:spectrin beta
VTRFFFEFSKNKLTIQCIRRATNGAEFLLQAHDDIEMGQWVTQLKAQCENIAAGEGRSLTLPATSQKDEPKKRSFFTLKKK